LNKLPLITAIASASLLLSQPASAGFFEDVTWVPQVGMQYKNLQFDQDLVGVDEPTDGDLDVNLPSLTLAFTAIYKKAYLSLKYEGTEIFDDAHTDSDVPFTNSSTAVERTDYTFTVGYNVWGGINLFAGYLDGETTLTPEPLCPTADFVDVPFPDCGPGFFEESTLHGNLAQDHYVLGFSDYEQTYSEDGWFLGGSYAWKISDVGTLSFSLAYADLDSTYEDNFGEKNFGVDFQFEGDATGLSYGINWSQPLTDRVGYYIDLRRQDYDIEAEGTINFPDATADSEEIMTTFTAGIQWYF
jgi:hypothetical protein